jgi:amidohydrolase
VDPLKAAVISITQLRAGEAFNVIPETVHLVGTVRTFEPQVREKVLARIEQLAAGLGQAHGCSIDVQVKQVAPPLVNDEGVYGKLVELLAQEFPSLIHHADQRWMGSEDMAYFLQRVPGCYLFFGSADAQRGLDAPHHNPAFDFDERVLPLATAVMAAAAWRLMESER